MVYYKNNYYFQLAKKRIKQFNIDSIEQIENDTSRKGEFWEFFSAIYIYMSEHLKTTFINIKDIEGIKKYLITDRDGNDIGIDLFDEKTMIVQCKNYKSGYSFKIEDITNSISLRIHDEKINYQLYFARPDDTKLGGKLRTHLHDKRFIDYPIPRKEFLDFLTKCIEEAKNYIEIDEKQDENNPDIRDDIQKEILDKIIPFLSSPKNIFSLCAPTGLGKTVIVLKTIEHLKYHRKEKILILVNKVNI